MIKAIIFDIDGVLVDSREANIHLYQTIIKKAGYPAVSREAILECFHLPLKKSIERLIKVDDPKEIERVFSLASDPSVRDADLFVFPEKLEEVLEELHKKYRLAIVTSRIKIGVDSIFSIKEIKHLFEVVVAYEDYSNPKPDPEPLLVALERLRLSPSEAIYVGDSATDIDAARAANMKSIYLSPNTHKDASSVINDFNEIPKTIELIDA